eukprot:COSAG02_NODE_1356_length_13093_cov_351.171695_7_plen_144_part_00
MREYQYGRQPRKHGYHSPSCQYTVTDTGRLSWCSSGAAAPTGRWRTAVRSVRGSVRTAERAALSPVLVPGLHVSNVCMAPSQRRVLPSRRQQCDCVLKNTDFSLPLSQNRQKSVPGSYSYTLHGYSVSVSAERLPLRSRWSTE